MPASSMLPTSMTQNGTTEDQAGRKKMRLIVTIVVPLLVLASTAIAVWLICRRRQHSSADSKSTAPVAGKATEIKGAVVVMGKSSESCKQNAIAIAPAPAVASENANRDANNISVPSLGHKSNPPVPPTAASNSPVAPANNPAAAAAAAAAAPVVPACLAPSGVSNDQALVETSSKSSDSSLINTPITKSQITSRIESLKKIKETILKMPSKDREKSKSSKSSKSSRRKR